MHTTPQPSLRATRWSGMLLAIYASFSLVAPVSHAQPAINSIANPQSLPLRNVLIEVRQTQHTERQSTAAQGQQSDATTQQVLVLNGRSAHIGLVTHTPMRVVQTWMRNGALVVVPGTVLLDANTGFNATPRWNGSDTMELEVAATQTAAAGGAASAGRPTLQSSSVVIVPLDSWVTLAQSATQEISQRSGTAGQAQWSEQADSEVQVRVTLR